MVLSHEPQDREALRQYAATALAGLYRGEPTAGPFAGGRGEGLRRLEAFDAARYGEQHNDVLHECTSKLSPYIRHGLLSPREVRDSVVARAGAEGSRAFLMQLLWRSYWYAVYRHRGGAENEEPREEAEDPEPQPLHPRTPAHTEARETPERRDAYGPYCVDESLRRLRASGFIAYAARLWVASYLLHFEKLPWREGYRLFQEHLADADPVVNSLSWRWVLGNLTGRPFFFTRASVMRDTGGEYCERCTVYRCPFEGTLEAVEDRALRAKVIGP